MSLAIQIHIKDNTIRIPRINFTSLIKISLNTTLKKKTTEKGGSVQNRRPQRKFSENFTSNADFHSQQSLKSDLIA